MDELDTLMDQAGAVGDADAEAMLARLRQRMFEVRAEPVKLGRYLLLDRLGAGGMGIVYLAFDPDLDRRIAVKILRSGGTASQSRLLREARAMARLSHPNVVQVHEVGTRDDDLFVAMEYVDGITLTRWMKEPGRTWRERLAGCMQAGEGLAAAHAADLVHRDFKPSNVLCGKDGRIRVTDFGLVGGSMGEAADVPTVESSVQDAEDLTRTGAVLGTPAYMAPEQHLGRLADARADQFSFCVTAWEALYGEHPFAGDGYEALPEAVIAGKIRAPHEAGGVPPAIRRLLERGMAADPERRHASMRTLLDALDDAARPRGPLRWVAGIVVLVGVVGGVVWASDDPAAHCEAEVVELWDPPSQEAVSAAFLGTKAVFAGDAVETVSRTLETYSTELATRELKSCQDNAGGGPGALLGELRAACLRDRRTEVGALLEIFVSADEAVVRHAPAAVDNLTPVAVCDQVGRMASVEGLPDDEAGRAAVAEVRRELARAHAQHVAGRYEAGFEMVEAPVKKARELGYQPLIAEALEIRGLLARKLGRDEEAAADLTESYFAAQASRHVAIAAGAASRLTHLFGHGLQKPEEAHLWARHAQMLIDELDDPGIRQGQLYDHLTTVLKAEGRYEEARKQGEQAVEELTRSAGPDSPQVATSLMSLANVLVEQNHNADAEQAYRRALEIRRKVYGDTHPAVATVLNNLATSLQLQRKSADALTHYLEVLKIREATLPAGHPRIARVHNNLANLYLETGELEAARESGEKALAMLEEARGKDHPVLTYTLNVLGGVYSAREDHDLAVAAYDRALGIAREKLGEDHPQLLNTLLYLADAQIQAERWDDASTTLAELTRRAGANEDAGRMLRRQAQYLGAIVDLGRSRWSPALETLEAVFEDANTDPDVTELELADVRFSMARALWELGEEGEALDLATKARAGFGDADARATDEIDAWIGAHPRP